jgi:hypothetical protein
LPDLFRSIADGSHNTVLTVVPFVFSLPDVADWDFAGDTALPTGNAFSVRRDRHTAAVGADIGEPLCDEVDEVALAEIWVIEPPQFTYTDPPLIVYRKPRTVIENTKGNAHLV